MLSVKDVLYLSDILEQSDVLNKKIANDLSQIKNNTVKEQIEDVNQTLIETFDTLVNILKKEAKA